MVKALSSIDHVCVNKFVPSSPKLCIWPIVFFRQSMGFKMTFCAKQLKFAVAVYIGLILFSWFIHQCSTLPTFIRQKLTETLFVHERKNNRKTQFQNNAVLRTSNYTSKRKKVPFQKFTRLPVTDQVRIKLTVVS